MTIPFDPKKHKVFDQQGREVNNVVSYDANNHTFEQLLLDENGNTVDDDNGKKLTIQRFGRLTLKEKEKGK